MLTRRNNRGAQQVAANGGMMDEAGQVVNGVEVPAGSLAEEVADDVPAMLSEGEFVVPADVVRYVGLERLMKMRDKAKEGLERMEEMGQMGNAEEVDNPDQQFDEMDDDNFENEIDSIMGEVDDEDVNMQTERMFAAGGYVTGSDLSKSTQNPSVDVRYYKHDDGRVMYITHINEKPMTSVPDGFNEVSADEARKVGKKAEEAAAVGGDSGGGAVSATSGGGNGGDGGDGISGIGPTGLASTGLGLMALSENLSDVPSLKGKAMSAVTGAIGKGLADQSIDATTQGFNAMSSAANVPGIASVSGKQGQVTTVSNPATIAAADTAMFGLDQAAMTGMTTNNMGQTVSNNASIAAQNAAMGGISTGIGVGDFGEAANTGMTSVGGVSVSNADTIAAQNEALFGVSDVGSSSIGTDSTSAESVSAALGDAGFADTGGYSDSPANMDGFDGSNSGGGDGGSDGTYCCSRMVHLGEWKQTKELTRMHIWHQAQPEWWKAGYSVWGKIVANTLFKKKGFWTDVMNAFYARHIKKQPRTLKSVIADLVIYPGVFVCGMIWRNAPETTRFVTEDEMK